jgi:hypothetical protein
MTSQQPPPEPPVPEQPAPQQSAATQPTAAEEAAAAWTASRPAETRQGVTQPAMAPRPRGAEAWAAGLTLFAGIIMLVIGTFQSLQGLAAIIDDELFVVGPGYAYEFDVTAWGWVHLIGGIIVAVAGVFVLRGALWARIVGMAVAALSAVANFFYIPYYPVWSVLIIALDIVVIWALATYRREAVA